jgi:tetratricopeptide (TPR) repeat protein
MWIFFLSQSIWAASFTMNEAPCPIGDDRVRIYDVVSDNQLGGFDSDLASYSSGEQARQYVISTCFSNFLSLYGKDMTRVIPEDKATEILSAIDAQKSTLQNPNEPKIWERYELAAISYGLLDENDLFLAKVYLDAMWSARDTVVGYHPNLNGPIVIDQLLSQASVELAKSLTTEQRKTVLFNLARVAHRGGYSQQRDDFIQAFLNLPTLTETEKSAANEFINVTQIIEPYFQKKIIMHIEKALEQNIETDDNSVLYYTIADLHRRKNNPNLALKYYQKVLEMNQSDEIIRELSNYFINKQ